MKRDTYQRIARFYDLLDLPFEKGRYRALRQGLWQGIGGRVLDAGAGTGRNIRFYPAGGEVVAIDLSPAMLERARQRAARAGATVEFAEMDVRALAFPDASFDAAVASFLFCVLDPQDQLPALRELKRVCRPGGRIRILEYCRSADPRRRLLQRLWAPWVRWAYGAGFDRDTSRYLAPAGLVVEDERFVFHDIIKLISARA